MAKKIKLTLEQLKAIKDHKNKKLKITEEQLNKIKEEFGYKPTPEPLKPSSKITRQFNKHGDDLKGFKAENEKLTGHPIGGDGGDEYNPQSDDEYRKTYDTLNENEIFEFNNFIINMRHLLKSILRDGVHFKLDRFWEILNIDKKDMLDLLLELKIIEYSDDNLVVVTDKNLPKKLKRLYNLIDDMESTNESISFGDDIEENNLPSGADKDSFAPYNDDKRITKPKKVEGEFNAIYYNNDIAILKDSTGNLFMFYHEEIPKEDFADYAEISYEILGRDENGGIDIDYDDFELDGDIIENYVNDNYDELSKGEDYEAYENGADFLKLNKELVIEILKMWGSDEELRKLFKIKKSTKESVNETDNLSFTKLKDKNGRIRKLTKKNADYRPSDGEKKCETCKNFKKNKCFIVRGVINKEMVCDYYDKEINTNETTVAGAAGDGGSSGPYVSPKMWAKDKKNWSNSNEPMYPSGQIVQKENYSIKLTKEQFQYIKENMDKTQWPKGKFVEFDDCVKFNNNKEAENGGCSQGAVDNVVKTKGTDNSVISKNARYYKK